MIEAKQLGERLRTARQRRGLSQQAVADSLNVPRTGVTNMESGSRSVSTLELTKLAEIYAVPLAIFLSPDEQPVTEDLSTLLHSAIPEMTHTADGDAEIKRILNLCAEGTVLKEMLGQSCEPTIPEYATHMKNVGDAIQQGETVAKEERRRLGLGNAPLLDIAEFTNDQGIWTAATQLPDSLSGLFVSHPTVGLVILVNRKHWAVRRRFSYSHEYAHTLFDRHEIISTTRQENSIQLKESRANAFAAAFLMPADGVAEQLALICKGLPSRRASSIFDVATNSKVDAEVRAKPGSQEITYHDAASLARHFGVSYEATVWRLKSLNHISKRATASLIHQTDLGRKYIELLGVKATSDMYTTDSETMQELRGRLLRLTIEAFRQEEISRGRLIEIAGKLEIEGSDLLELAEAARGE